MLKVKPVVLFLFAIWTSSTGGSAVADRLEVFIEAKERVAVSTDQSSGPGEFQIEFLAVF